MDLINDPWIPIRRASGRREHIAPWQLTETDDPVLALAAPRPDFNGALMQFLIGLLQTAAAPMDDEAWAEWLEIPPSPETLRSRFEPFADAFDLDGEGPRFLQDFEELDGEFKPIDALLIDAPGAKSTRDNTDHFIKRDFVSAICPACAATALFTLQTNAPAGGVGNRTSLRGGGPLTTLVTLDPAGSGLEETLWRNLWLNVLNAGSLGARDTGTVSSPSSDIFPWLAPTRTSEAKSGRETTPMDAHPLQMYWGMPRRIRIDWETEQTGQCDICAAQDAPLISRYVTRNYGINYTGPWQHPLSPHYIDSRTGEPLPQHAQPDGFSYRHWPGWVEGTDDVKPAQVVAAFQTAGERRMPAEQLRLWVFGYDMDNMKPLCWYEAITPLILIRDEAVRHDFALRVKDMVAAAERVAGEVQRCIKEAWFKRPGDARGDTAFLKEDFFQRSEGDFYTLLSALKLAVESGEDIAVLQGWYEILQSAAVRLFDDHAARGDISFADPRRIVMAEDKLKKALRGKKLRELLKISKHKEEAA